MQQLRSFLASAWTSFRQQSRRTQAIIAAVAGVVLIACCAIGSAASQAGNSTASDTTANTHTSVATTKPKPTATIHYPPKTEADLRGLAAHGDANAVHEFHSESVGLTGVCPQPKREVTVDPSVTGKQLAEDLLAYFYAQSLASPCGSLVVAFHSQSEADGAYTAGRVLLDVTDASGQGNIDPHATNLTYTITLDVGDVVSGQEYTVTYQS